MKKLFGGLLIGALLFTGCGKEKEVKESPKVLKKVAILAVESRVISDKFEADTSAVAKNKIPHIIDTTGTVERVYFNSGESVRKGQEVVHLKDQKAAGDYKSAKSAMDSAKVNLETRRTNFNKYKSLYDKELISETEFLEHKTRFSDSEAQYLMRKAQFDDISTSYSELNRTALISGTIANLNIKEGNEVKRGDTLFTIIDESMMEFTIEVPGIILSKLTIGSTAQVKIPDIIDEEFSGKVIEVNPIASPDTKKYKVKVVVDNSGRKIKDGMYAKVVVPTGERTVNLIPESSIVVKSLQSYVYIVEEGKAKRVEVTPGVSVGDLVEITSEKVKSGSEVIVEGISNLTEGEEVEVTKR